MRQAGTSQAKRTSSKPPQARHDAFAWVETFLAALRLNPNISAAARQAGVTRQYVYDVRSLKTKEGEQKEGDELVRAQEFAAAWDDAIQESLDELEAEARRRAFAGLVRKKFTRGGEAIMDPATGQQYFEYEYSDTLMQFLLRAHRYGDKSKVEITGKDGAPIAVRTDFAALNDDELESEIDKLLAKRSAALGGFALGTRIAAQGETA